MEKRIITFLRQSKIIQKQTIFLNRKKTEVNILLKLQLTKHFSNISFEFFCSKCFKNAVNRSLLISRKFDTSIFSVKILFLDFRFNFTFEFQRLYIYCCCSELVIKKVTVIRLSRSVIEIIDGYGEPEKTFTLK